MTRHSPATRALLGVAEARFTVGRSTDVLGLTTVQIMFGAVLVAAWGANSLLEHLPGFGVANWLTIAYLSLGGTIGTEPGRALPTAGLLVATWRGARAEQR